MKLAASLQGEAIDISIPSNYSTMISFWHTCGVRSAGPEKRNSVILTMEESK